MIIGQVISWKSQGWVRSGTIIKITGETLHVAVPGYELPWMLNESFVKKSLASK